MARDPLRTAGTLLFVATAQYLIFEIIAESLYQGYSVSAQPISDLGATCRAGTCVIVQPTSTIFDASVFVLGALAFVGDFYLYISGWRLIGGLAALSAWGVMGVAIFPETTGVLHSIVSLIAFLFTAVAALASFRVVRPPMSYFWVILGVIALVALVLYAGGDYLGLGQGGMERMIAYPDLIFVLTFAASLLSRKEQSFPPLGVP